MSSGDMRRGENDKKQLGRGVSPTAICAERWSYVVGCPFPFWGYGTGIQGLLPYPPLVSPCVGAVRRRVGVAGGADFGFQGQGWRGIGQDVRAGGET